MAERGLREVAVRDAGLLEAALSRPRASVFEVDAYHDLHPKAAALLHSVVVHHGWWMATSAWGWPL